MLARATSFNWYNPADFPIFVGATGKEHVQYCYNKICAQTFFSPNEEVILWKHTHPTTTYKFKQPDQQFDKRFGDSDVEM